MLIVSLPDPPEAGLEKVVGVTVKVRGVPAAGLTCNWQSFVKLPSAVFTSITASPVATGVTVAVSPDPATVATEEVRLVQVTSWLVAPAGRMAAVIVRLPLPRTTVSFSGVMFTPVTGTVAARTCTSQVLVRLLPSVVVTVIVVFPAAKAVAVIGVVVDVGAATTNVFELVQVSVLLVASEGVIVTLSAIVPPISTVSFSLLIVKAVIGLLAGAWAFWLIVIICFKAVLSVA